MRSTSRKIILSLVVSLASLISIFALFSTTLHASHEASGDVYCVVPSGEPTGPFAMCDQVFTSVQTAVSSAVGGEEIRIAAGIYTDVHEINTHWQVVYLDKDLVLQGGYIPPFDNPPNSQINHSVLDAAGNGRVVYIAAGTTATLSGLHITGGNATTNDGQPSNDGGGIYAFSANITLNDNYIYDNVASSQTSLNNLVGGSGGGIFADNCQITMTNNLVYGNLAGYMASGFGGGILIRGNSLYNLTANEIVSNTAQNSGIYGLGGGIAIGNSNGRLSYNVIHHNIASDDGDVGWGGGVYISEDRNDPAFSTIVEHNMITQNLAASQVDGYGGGMYFTRWQPDSTNSRWQILLDNNTIQENTALAEGSFGYGGGLAFLRGYITLTMTHNIILSNTAVISGSTGLGGGMLAVQSIVHSTHNQITGNTAVVTATEMGQGGGAYYGSSQIFHEQDLLIGNHATVQGSGYGGGIYQNREDGNDNLQMQTHLVNTVLNSNQAHTGGSAAALGDNTEMHLAHTTISQNQGNSAAVYLGVLGGNNNALFITNTIMSGQDTGLFVGNGNTAQVRGVLWHDTVTAVATAPFGSYSIYYQTIGDPMFATDGYHIQADSDARWRGLPTGISTDIDVETRPYTPTLGVDEYWISFSWLPLIAHN